MIFPTKAEGQANFANAVVVAIALLMLATATSSCEVGAAHGAQTADTAMDGGETLDAGSAPLMGLTRAQVRARRGPPTEIRGHDWIYTPDQEGCRDVITSEVLTFKGGVVKKFRLQRKQPGKVCSRRR